MRQKCQAAFSSATTTTFPSSSFIGDWPSICQCGASLQMVDWLLSSTGEVQRRPGSEAKHRANNDRMAPGCPFPTEGGEIKSLDFYPTEQTLMNAPGSHFGCLCVKKSNRVEYIPRLPCSLVLRLEEKQVACVYSEAFKAFKVQVKAKPPPNKHLRPIREEFGASYRYNTRNDPQSTSVCCTLS